MEFLESSLMRNSLWQKIISAVREGQPVHLMNIDVSDLRKIYRLATFSAGSTACDRPL